MDDLNLALCRPFPVSAISWRVGATTKDKAKGIALAYIDARDVMKRLDEVVGPMNWQARYPTVTDQLVICELGIWSDEHSEWNWKANGAGDTAVEAEKGKLSDALKRAAVLWGIGRYLYSLPNVWVALDSYKRIVTPPVLPPWATPEGFDSIMAKRKAAA